MPSSSQLTSLRHPVLGSGQARRRIVSAVRPNFSAMDTMAGHCEEYAPSCSNTSRTTRSRTPGEYLVLLSIAPILSNNGASGKPGSIHFRHACRSLKIEMICSSINRLRFI